MRSAFTNFFFCLTISGGIGCAFIFPGCRLSPQAPTARPGASLPVKIGEIAVVDEGQRFVLIDLESNLYVPEPGLQLRARNAAGAIAHLRTSPEQKRPFIAADIIDGQPGVGDEVLR